ncbi:MAG: transglutaminase-like domain-containing protein [Ilumatobacteraceae bacterium]
MDPNTTKARFRELLRLPDHELPLDVLCFLICQLAGLEIDVDDEQRKLDISALPIRPDFNGVMTHLFQGRAAVRGNAEDYYNIDNSMLSEVHRNGLGIPITLSVLGMEIGRRAGVGIAGVGMPGHFLVRSTEDHNVFADPFGGGRILDQDGVRALFTTLTSGRAPWHDRYLRPIGARDIVFRILNNVNVACTKSFTDAPNLPWVHELLSWFPHGSPFDVHAASKAMARFN